MLYSSKSSPSAKSITDSICPRLNSALKCERTVEHAIPELSAIEFAIFIHFVNMYQNVNMYDSKKLYLYLYSINFKNRIALVFRAILRNSNFEKNVGGGGYLVVLLYIPHKLNTFAVVSRKSKLIRKKSKGYLS